MKENKELEQSDIAIENDMEVDCDIGRQITVYIETWFDVDKKFGTHTADDDGTWLNMYGKYNPYEDTLLIECEVSHDREPSEYFDYTPTPGEAQLIKEMIAEKIRLLHKQTPKEFCESAAGQAEEVYVYKNTKNFTVKRCGEQQSRIRAYMDEHGYLKGGGTTVSLPMSMAGENYRSMVEYCQSRGIFKIVVEDHRDIAGDDNTLRRVLNDLCDKGFTVELAGRGIAYAPQDQSSEPDEGVTMGGM